MLKDFQLLLQSDISLSNGTRLIQIVGEGQAVVGRKIVHPTADRKSCSTSSGKLPVSNIRLSVNSDRLLLVRV